MSEGRMCGHKAHIDPLEQCADTIDPRPRSPYLLSKLEPLKCWLICHNSDAAPPSLRGDQAQVHCGSQMILSYRWRRTSSSPSRPTIRLSSGRSPRLPSPCRGPRLDSTMSTRQGALLHFCTCTILLAPHPAIIHHPSAATFTS